MAFIAYWTRQEGSTNRERLVLLKEISPSKVDSTASLSSVVMSSSESDSRSSTSESMVVSMKPESRSSRTFFLLRESDETLIRRDRRLEEVAVGSLDEDDDGAFEVWELLVESSDLPFGFAGLSQEATRFCMISCCHSPNGRLVFCFLFSFS